MDKAQKEVIQAQLNNEKACLNALKESYQGALDDINGKIAELLGRDDANMQNVIYQVQYQQALKGQMESALTALQTQNFETVSQYLTTCYEEGYLGAIYSMQAQGIPLIFPIDQAQVVEAITKDTKLSTNLYSALGKDINKLKKDISAEISRGISTNMTYTDIAKNVARYAGISKNNATRIARTEGHRISSKATLDACEKAKANGADVVKQWDATLDGKTRDSHRQVDGEIVEIDEPFSNGLMYPSDPSGDPEETINCRCVLLERARWAVEDEQENGFTKAVVTDDGTQIVDFSDAKDYKSFKKDYWKAIDDANGRKAYYEGYPKDWKTFDSDNVEFSTLIKDVNPNYDPFDVKKESGYSRNCPNCACAYELRERGLDVSAKPYVKGGSHKLNREPWKAWIDPDIHEVTDLKKMNEYLNSFDDGSRFGVAIRYVDRTDHVINAKKVDGQIQLFDTQSGKMVESIDFDSVSDVKLWKTNELELSDMGKTACESR